MPVAYSSEEGPLSKSRNYKLAVEICVGESLKVKYDSGLEPGFKTMRGRVPNGAKQCAPLLGDFSIKTKFTFLAYKQKNDCGAIFLSITP